MPLESFTDADDSGRPQLQADEQISFTADNTQLFLRSDKSEGAGTLYVTTKHLIWQALDRRTGYRMDYPYVLLHAVSRDTSSFPHPCLYAQLDDEVAEEAFHTATMRQQAHNEAEDDNDEEQEEEEEEPQPISDLRFVPDNAGILDALYKAVSECAALHPDSDLSDGEGDFMFNADELRANMDREGGEEEEEDGQGYYGQGGDDGAVEYGMRDGSSNEARLASLAMRTGLSAEEMFADDDAAEEEEEGAEADVEEEERFAKGKPDDGQAQLANAKQQVDAAAAIGSGQKREREPDTENKQ